MKIMIVSKLNDIYDALMSSRHYRRYTLCQPDSMEPAAVMLRYEVVKPDLMILDCREGDLKESLLPRELRV